MLFFLVFAIALELLLSPSLLAQELTPAEENSLGVEYAEGKKREQNDSKAMQHFRKAAEQGDLNAQQNLALMYLNHRGGSDELQGKSKYPLPATLFEFVFAPQLEKKALYWFRSAAEAGNAKAQYNLALLLEQGKVVPKNEIEAAHWYQKAAEQNNAQAMNNLAAMQQQGRGIKKDEKQAFSWFLKSAELKNANAASNLSFAYKHGWGVTPDPKLAAKWAGEAKKRSEKAPIQVAKSLQRTKQVMPDIASLGDAAKEVQIFALSSDLVLKPAGVFRVRISAFVPLQSVSVNGESQKLAGSQEFQADFSIPYTKLTPGENKFLIETSTQLGKQKKELIVFYETDKVKRKSKKKGKAKGPFALIAIFAYSDDEKYADAGTTHSFKGNMILLPSWKHKLEGGSTLALKGLFVKDMQYDPSKGMFMKKLTLEWARPKTGVGDLTMNVAMDWLSLKDKDWAVPTRDPWISSLKSQASNVSSSIKLKNKVDKTTSWDIKFARKNKRTYVCDTGASSCYLDGSGHSTALTAGYSFKKWSLSNQAQANYTDTNENTDSKDKFSYYASWKSTYTIKPVKLSLQLKSTETKNRQFATSTRITTHDRKDELTSNISYPFKPWMIFAFSRKMQQQTSNLSNREYQQNIHKIQVTLMF